MRKDFSSTLCSKLFFAALLSGIFFISPGDALAKIDAGGGGMATVAQLVNGTIKDAVSDKPLVGASITLKGTTQSTSSDVNGAFSIEVPGSNSVLVVSYVGFVTQEVAVGTNAQLTIALQPSSSDLAQVVVV